MNDFRIKGAFFENVSDTGPAFTGFVEIDGVKTQIALWPKTSAKGQNYLQVAEDRKRQSERRLAPAPRSPFDRKPVTRNDPVDLDDDIQF
jgi:hypothetical protein